MKNLLITLAAILPFFSFAQNSEGEIRYQETVKLKIEMPEDSEHQFSGMLPSEQTFKKVLFFNTSSSLYKDVQEEDDQPTEISGSEGGATFKMVIMRPDNSMHKNLAEGTKTEKTDFFGKTFLIEGDLQEYTWKLTGEQKEILEFPCQKAVFKDSTKTVEAWFTMQIPVSAGPGEYGKLPGMILEVNIDDGSRVISAQKVTFKTLEEDQIQPPKKGKKVTQEEYEKIVEEKTREMEEEMGGGGGIKIRIRN